MSGKNTVSEKRVGERIAAAWIASVINPALTVLAFEQQQLKAKNYMWQFPGRLGSLRQVKQMIPFGCVPNLELFEMYYPVISENIKIRDEEVAQLAVTCMNLQREILDSGELEKIFTRLTTPENLARLGKRLDDMFPGGYKPEDLGWIAQEVINHTGNLPTHINHYPLWNAHQKEFMEVVNSEQVKGAERLVDRAGEKLLKTTEHLIKLLEDARTRLSIEYDVPPRASTDSIQRASKEAVERLSKAKPGDVQEIAGSQIQLLSAYYQLVLDQAKKGFIVALIMASVGVVFFLAAVLFIFYWNVRNAAYVSAVGGAIVEVIAGLNFYLYSKTSGHLADFHNRLDGTQRYLLANSICESLEGEYKQTARIELVRAMARIDSSGATSQATAAAERK